MRREAPGGMSAGRRAPDAQKLPTKFKNPDTFSQEVSVNVRKAFV